MTSVVWSLGCVDAIADDDSDYEDAAAASMLGDDVAACDKPGRLLGTTGSLTYFSDTCP